MERESHEKRQCEASGRRPLGLTVLAFTLSLLAGSALPARAQVKAPDKAAAEALFDEGLRLMREGQYAEACERLERSQSIEHGLGTMLYLADCYERIDRTASAWALFREAASLAAAEGQRERAESGRARARALKPRLSWLTVEVPEAHRVEGLEVLRGGQAVPPGVWGTPVPVDPGTYALEARAPGFETWQAKVEVEGDGSRVRAQVPQLAPRPETSAASEPTAEAGRTAATAAESVAQAAGEAPAGSRTRRLRLAGWSVGAAGAAGVVLGAVFGGLAIARDNEADDLCQGNSCDSSAGVSASQDARRFANVSTAMWAVGGALLGTGLSLLFIDPDRESRATRLSPEVGPGHAGLSLRGAF